MYYNFRADFELCPFRSCKGFIELIQIQTAASNIMADALTRPSEKAPVKFVNESGEVQIAAICLEEYLENGQGNYQPLEELELEGWVRAAQNHGMSHLVGSSSYLCHIGNRYRDAVPDNQS